MSNGSQSDPSATVFHAALARLARLRATARGMLTLQTLAWVIAVGIACLIGMGLVDFALRWPGWVRGGLLGAVLVGAGWVIVTRVIPAARFNPSLTEFALRLERTAGGRAAGLSNLLASAIDLGAAGQVSPNVMNQAAAGLSRVGLGDTLQPKRLLISGGTLAAVVAGFAMLFAAQPGLVSIGAHRVLTPWSSAQWPMRNDVEDVTKLAVHPIGSALPIRAALVRSDRDSAATRVEAIYRLIDASGKAGPTRRVVLTSQEKPIALMADRGDGQTIETTGTLFERLIEPGAIVPAETLAGGSTTSPTAHRSEPGQIEYAIESSDDRTTWHRITLVRPPVVTGAKLTMTPPAYASATPVDLDLGMGVDERATAAGVLVGSTVAMTLEFSKPVPVPAGPALAESLGNDFAAAVSAGSATITKGEAADDAGRSTRWLLNWTVTTPMRLPVKVADHYGIKSENEPVYRVDARDDRPAEATITKPAEDGEVLPTAVIDAAAEGRDDVGLVNVLGQMQIARRPAGSEGAAPEPDTEQATFATATASADAGTKTTLTAATTLDLSTLAVKPGEELWLTALAKDSFDLAGKTHEPTRSAVRKLRVISAEQFVEQIWNELGGVRRSAISLAEQEQKNRDNVKEGRDASAAARDQNAVTEGATRQQQTVERLAQRAQANKLDDPELDSLMKDARALLDEARESSAKAQQSLRDAAEAKQAGKSAKEQSSRADAQNQQADAQKALEQAADALDRGQDAWATKREVERLLEDQKDLREATEKTAAETRGKETNELSQKERAEIDQNAQKQDDLAQRAEDAIRKMQEKAEQIRENNPSAAGALNEAAAKGQRQELQKKMEQAAKDMKQNKQQNAGQQQQAAEKTMEEMLAEMNDAQKNRDETLARELASIIQSLDALIKRQVAEIATLTNAMESANLTGRDESQIKIRSAALGVAEQAKAAGREARETADIIGAATDAMGNAVGHLRAVPTKAADAVTSEQEALAKLREAREKAEKAKQAAEQRENARKKAELKKAYKELLDEQVALKQQATELEAMEPGRKRNAAARELAPLQDEIRRKASDLASKTTEIGESEMFSMAHARLDEVMATAAERLTAGEVGARVTGRQAAAARVLEALLDALADDKQKDDEFREQQQDQPGGDSGGQQNKPQLIPPVADLKLLRRMQAEALQLTREAEGSDAAAKAEAAGDAGKVQGELAKRAEALLKKLMERGGGGGGVEGGGGPGDEEGAGDEPPGQPPGQPPGKPQGDKP